MIRIAAWLDIINKDQKEQKILKLISPFKDLRDLSRLLKVITLSKLIRFLYGMIFCLWFCTKIYSASKNRSAKILNALMILAFG